LQRVSKVKHREVNKTVLFVLKTKAITNQRRTYKCRDSYFVGILSCLTLYAFTINTSYVPVTLLALADVTSFSVDAK